MATRTVTGKNRTMDSRRKVDPEKEQSNPEIQDRMQRRDAYTMFSPNEKKRQQIERQAKKETEQFEKYKQSKKVQNVSYVGTPGGGTVSETQARQKLDSSQRHAKYDRLQKMQNYRTEKKKSEDKVYEEKKVAARKKSETNAKADARRQEQLEEDHRRKNEAFLARLERNTKQSQRQKRVQGKQQDQKTSSSEGAGCIINPTFGESEHLQEDDSMEPIDELMNLFPDVPRSMLEDILLQCNGDIDQVTKLLVG